MVTRSSTQVIDPKFSFHFYLIGSSTICNEFRINVRGYPLLRALLLTMRFGAVAKKFKAVISPIISICLSRWLRMVQCLIQMLQQNIFIIFMKKNIKFILKTRWVIRNTKALGQFRDTKNCSYKSLMFFFLIFFFSHLF